MIAIYDIAGSHYNTVKATFDHYYNGEHEVSRVFYNFSGIGENSPNNLLADYVEANNIKVVIIPYYNLTKGRFTNIIDLGAICVLPINNSLGGFLSTVRVTGGVSSTSIGESKGLDFYSECSNLQGSSRTAPSYVCAKIGAQLANLIDDGYSAWEARQILRQNADGYNNWSQTEGFGKVPDAITIPETIEKIHPVDVNINLPTNSSPNQGLAVLEYRSIDGNFKSTGEEYNVSESPIIIEGEGRGYSIDYRNDYGGEFTELNFELGEYEFTEAPKNPELFYYRQYQSNRRIHIAQTTNSFSSFVDEEAPFDRYQYRVYENGEIIFTATSDYNTATLLLETYNNPDFNFTGSGRTYQFQFKFLNIHGESEWSELLEIQDSDNQESQLFDFRSEPVEPEEEEPEESEEEEEEEDLPEEEPEPFPDPTHPSATRTGNQVTITRNETVATAKIFRKLRINDDWVEVGETTEETFTDEITETTNYIYAIQLTNSETESALSEPVYVAGEVEQIYVQGVV